MIVEKYLPTWNALHISICPTIAIMTRKDKANQNEASKF